MSNRLTNAMRESLITTLIARTFAERDQALKNENAQLFEQLIKLAWGEYYPHIEAIPAGMLNGHDGFRVYQCKKEEDSFSVYFTGHYPMVIPAALGSQWNADDFATLPKAAQAAIRAFAKKNDAHAADKKNARDKLNAAVYGVTTLKKLYELWPELGTVPGIESSDSAPAGKQLAVSREELNAIFGLPVGA